MDFLKRQLWQQRGTLSKWAAWRVTAAGWRPQTWFYSTRTQFFKKAEPTFRKQRIPHKNSDLQFPWKCIRTSNREPYSKSAGAEEQQPLPLLSLCMWTSRSQPHLYSLPDLHHLSRRPLQQRVKQKTELEGIYSHPTVGTEIIFVFVDELACTLSTGRTGCVHPLNDSSLRLDYCIGGLLK